MPRVKQTRGLLKWDAGVLVTHLLDEGVGRSIRSHHHGKLETTKNREAR